MLKQLFSSVLVHNARDQYLNASCRDICLPLFTFPWRKGWILTQLQIFFEPSPPRNVTAHNRIPEWSDWKHYTTVRQPIT